MTKGSGGWLLSDNVVRGVRNGLLWNFKDIFLQVILVYARMLD